MLSTLAELLGVSLIAVFAWFVWQPLPLAVVGAALIVGSYASNRTPKLKPEESE